MAQHYYIYSNNPKHTIVYTKGLRAVRPKFLHPNYYIEFKYKDGYELSWYFDDEKSLNIAFEKVKKSLPVVKNIDSNLKL